MKLFQSLFSKKDITSLSSPFLLLKKYLVLNICCAYLGALVNTSSLVKAQCFFGLLQVEAGEEELHSRNFWPFIQAKNCQRSLKVKSGKAFKIMSRVCFSSDSFHSQKWLNYFYLEINKQNYFFGNEDQTWKIPIPRWKFDLVTCNCKSISELRTEAPGELQLWLLPGTPAIMEYLDVELGAFPPSFLPAWQLPAQICSWRNQLFWIFHCSFLCSVPSCLISGESFTELQRAVPQNPPYLDNALWSFCDVSGIWSRDCTPSSANTLNKT